MNIVIVGAGKMGSELCLSLREEGHDITLIEKNTDRLQAMMETCDILGVAGNGAFYGVQKNPMSRTVTYSSLPPQKMKST